MLRILTILPYVLFTLLTLEAKYSQLAPTAAKRVALRSALLAATINADGVGSLAFAGETALTPALPGIPLLGPSKLAGGLVVEDACPLWRYSERSDLVDGVQEFGALQSATVVPVVGWVRVTRTYEAAAVVHTYSLVGDTLVCQVAVTNKGTLPLRHFYVRHLAFNGAATSMTTQPWWIGYIGPAGPRVYTPAHWSRLGAGHVSFANYGLGISASGLGLCQRLPAWRGDAIGYWFSKDVQPGATINFTLKLRVSKNTDRDYLLGNYYTDHVAEHGALRFDPDHRPWVVFQRWGEPREGNPFGYHSLDWRLDTGDGAARMGRDLGPLIERAGCQGLLSWGLGNYLKPGEFGYSADFHAVPAPIKQAVPSLTAELDRRALKLGILARPAFYLVAGSYEAVNYLPVADTETFRAETLRRFKVLTALGSRASYLDDYLDIDATRLLWSVRQRLGRDYQWYAEFATDLTAPIAGVYCEAVGTPAFVPDYIAVLRRLYPQLPVIVRDRTGMEQGAFAAWCAERRFSALIDDWPLFTATAADGTNPLAEAIRATYAGRQVQTPSGWEWRPP